MNVNEIMQYLSYLLIAIGVMAFIVFAVTQVIKSWPGLEKLPTSAVVIVLSLILCPVSFVALMAYCMVHGICLYDSGVRGGAGVHGRLGEGKRDLGENRI